MRDACPVAYGHHLDAPDCPVCGQAWIAVLITECAAEIPDVEDEWIEGGLAEDDDR